MANSRLELLLASRLGYSCSPLRPARPRLPGPWSLKQGFHRYAEVLGKADEALDRQVFPPSFDSLGELEGEAHLLGKLLLRPATAHPFFSHTSPGVTHELVEV